MDESKLRERKTRDSKIRDSKIRAGNKRAREKRSLILGILWGISAAALLAVAAVYLVRMQEFYDTATGQTAAQSGKAWTDGTAASASGDGSAEPENSGAADADADKAGAGSRTGTDLSSGLGSADSEGADSGSGTEAGAAGSGGTAAAGTEAGTGSGTEAGAEAGSGSSAADSAVTETGAETNTGAGAGSGTGSGNEAAADSTAAAAGAGTGSGAGSSAGSDGTESDETSDRGYLEANGPSGADLDPAKKIVAFTFDDGPSKYTERILAALQANGASATFFMVGYNIEKFPERVKLIHEAGCEVGNHTLDHKRLTECSEEELENQVYGNEALIKALVPVDRVLVRPPYGSYNDTVKELVNVPMVNWSVDSRDWETKDADKIVAEIKNDVKDGYVVLMHDLYESTAEAVEKILPWLTEQGYQVTSVSAMYAARGEELKAGHVHRYTNTAEEYEKMQNTEQTE